MEPVYKGSTYAIASPFMAGILYSFTIMGLAAFFVTLLLTFTNQQEDSLTVYSYFVHAIAVFIGAFVSGKRIGNRGWYHGGLIGIFYILVIFIVGFLGFNQGVHLSSLFLAIAAFLVGALGGIIGINYKR